MSSRQNNICQTQSNNICQTQPLDFSKSSSVSSSTSSPTNSPPPPNMEYNINPFRDTDTDKVVTASSLPLCNPMYTRKTTSSITTAPIYPMNNQRGYPRSQNAKGDMNNGVSSQPRSFKHHHSSRKQHNSRVMPYPSHQDVTSGYNTSQNQEYNVGHNRVSHQAAGSAEHAFGRAMLMQGYAPLGGNERSSWQPMSARYMDAADQRAAVSAQLFLAHKNANMRVPELYSELLSRQAAAMTDHQAISSSAVGSGGYRETSPASSDRGTPPAMSASMYRQPNSEEYDDERQSPNRDGLNSTGSGSPGGSSGASCDSMEDEAASEKRKPMKKRKISTGLSSDN